MNSKSLLFLATLAGTTWCGSVLAQSSGAGSGGSGTASAAGTGTGAASNASATGSSASVAGAGNAAANASSGSVNAGNAATSGTPNMSSSMPSRSVLNTATPPATGAGAGESALPPGITTAPAQPGVSPLSGIPTSEIPAVSRGTTPIGPQPAGASNLPPISGSAVKDVTGSAQPNVTDPAASAAHPQLNPQIGMGATTVVPTPPPAAQAEVAPADTHNDLGQVWVAGHYSWVGGQWNWVDGTWQRPPNENAAWIPGSYDAQNKRWTEGHWETSVGATSRNAPAR